MAGHAVSGMLALATALCVGGCGGGDNGPEAIGSLRLIGDYSIRTKTMFDGVEFGGISGLDRAPDGSYWAISDERGGERGTPRFYNLSIALDDKAIKSVTINHMVYLQGSDGKPLPSTSRTVDPEGIRVTPNGNLYVSSEGNFSTNPASLFQPFVREIRADGSFVRDFEMPAAFNYVDNSSSGGRSNKLFEALAVTPDGQVFTANEDALIEDGPITTLQAGSVLRVVRLDVATGKATAQYAYQLPRIPLDKAATGSFPPDNGLPELLAVSNNEFIAVERAFADGVGNTIRLTRATIEPDTTDVRSFRSLVGASYKPMKRELLQEMPVVYQGVKLDNIEGISWGPRLPNGHRTLVLMADNNFADNQATQFLAFEILPR
ncbi:esterase-like activity of phytase family protein [Cupriavidus necator]|uniref:esterase-like activity of phytase family protein n=1 Tax=Cupriavidus necator TaxID=106590 RepID=UPI0039C13623